MLLQTNSYIVPKERRAEHARLIRRFRQALARIGLDQFEVYEQVGANWSPGGANGRYVQIMRFRDRQHQQSVQAAERQDHGAQHIIAEFCELINFPYQQQHGYFATGFYTSVLPVGPRQAPGMEAHAASEAPHVEHHEAEAHHAVAEADEEAEVRPEEAAEVSDGVFSEEPAEEAEQGQESAVAEAEPTGELSQADAAEEVAHESPAQLAHEEEVADSFLDAQGDASEPIEELGGHAPAPAEADALDEVSREISSADESAAAVEAVNEEELLLNDGALPQEPTEAAQPASEAGEAAESAEPELAAGELAGLEDFGLAFDDEALAEATAELPTTDLFESPDLSEFAPANAEDELAAAPMEAAPETAESRSSEIAQTVPEVAELTPPAIPTEEPHPGELGELGLDFDDAAIAEATTAEHHEALAAGDLGLHFHDELALDETPASTSAEQQPLEEKSEASGIEAEHIDLAAEEASAPVEAAEHHAGEASVEPSAIEVEHIEVAAEEASAPAEEMPAEVASEVASIEPLAESPAELESPAAPVAEDNLDDLVFDEAPVAEAPPAAEAGSDAESSPFAESTSVADAIHFGESTPTLEMLSPEAESPFAEPAPAVESSSESSDVEAPLAAAESAPAETTPAGEAPVEEFNLDEGLIFDDDDLLMDETSAEPIAHDTASASGENGRVHEHDALGELPSLDEVHDASAHEPMQHEARHEAGFDDGGGHAGPSVSENGKNGAAHGHEPAAAKDAEAPEEIDADLLEFDAFLRQLDEEHGRTRQGN